MDRNNPRNERLKRSYFKHIKNAGQKASTTVDSVRRAICRFEKATDWRDFGEFNSTSAVLFKEQLTSSTGGRGGGQLSKASIVSILNDVKSFFRWAAQEPGYRSKIKLTDIDYLNPSAKDVRAAQGGGIREFPTIEQIKTAFGCMPSGSEIDRRNRAVFALAALTGIRDAALASLKLKHIDLDRKLVLQNPNQVRTKFSKRIDTFWFRVGDEFEAETNAWVRYLREVRLFGNEDPLFPRSKRIQDENLCWAADGVEPIHWETTAPVRDIFKEAFTRAGLPYFTPHSFRHTLIHLAQTCCTIEELKAWSQNLGHETPLITVTSYGRLDVHRQGELIRARIPGERQDAMSEVVELLKELKAKK